jgi:hypothetical protein
LLFETKTKLVSLETEAKALVVSDVRAVDSISTLIKDAEKRLEGIGPAVFPKWYH